jgi:hypothetical protein
MVEKDRQESGCRKEDGGRDREQMLSDQGQGWGVHCPFPSSCSHTSFPLLQAQTSLELASSVGDCPRSPAHTSSFGVIKRPWKSLRSYQGCVGLSPGKRVHRFSVMESAIDQSSRPAADLQIDPESSCFSSVHFSFFTQRIKLMVSPTSLMCVQAAHFPLSKGPAVGFEDTFLP